MKLRIFAMAAAAVLFLGMGNTAQAETDIFGGYSFLNLGIDGGDRETVHGWMANVAGFVTPNFGIVGDFGGHYEDGVNIFEYMGGVRAQVPADSVTPFAQAVFGGTRFGFDGSSESFFSMGFGGGVDVPLSDQVSVRAVQFDWTPLKIDDMWETSIIRLGFGIVVTVP